MNSGNIIDNSIYLCLAEDVLSYVDQKGLSVETTIKIYYPALYNKNINSIDDLDDKRVTLVESTKKLLDKKTFNAFKTIAKMGRRTNSAVPGELMVFCLQ